MNCFSRRSLYDYFAYEPNYYLGSVICDRDYKHINHFQFAAFLAIQLDVRSRGHSLIDRNSLCSIAVIVCYHSGCSIDESNIFFVAFCLILDRCQGRICLIYTGSKLIEKPVSLFHSCFGTTAVKECCDTYTLETTKLIFGHGLIGRFYLSISLNALDEIVEQLKSGAFYPEGSTLFDYLGRSGGQGTIIKTLSAADHKSRRFFS